MSEFRWGAGMVAGPARDGLAGGGAWLLLGGPGCSTGSAVMRGRRLAARAMSGAARLAARGVGGRLGVLSWGASTIGWLPCHRDPIAKRGRRVRESAAATGEAAPGEPARRLRIAGPVQLELVSAGDGARPAAVWAGLPEPSRQAVLALLARLIGAGAIAEQEEDDQ